VKLSRKGRPAMSVLDSPTTSSDHLTFEIVRLKASGNSRLITVGMFALTICLSVGVQWNAWTDTPLFATGDLLACIGLVAFSKIMYPHKQMRPMAIACFVCSLLWSLQWLTVWNRSVYPFIGDFANMFFWSIGATGFLLSPRSTNVKLWEKRLIIGFLVSAPLQILLVFFSSPTWHGYGGNVWWPTLYESRFVYHIALFFLCVFWIILSVGMSFAAYLRVVVMKPMDRVLAIPVMAGICIVGLISAFTCVFQPFPPARENAMYFSFSMVMFAIQMGLAVAALARTIKRFTLMEKLSRRLARQVLSGDAIQQEFRDLLGDPTLEIFYWSEGPGAYVDATGATKELPSHRRFLAELQNGNGEPLAVVVGDQMLVDHVSMLESFLAASAIAIENVQLQASIRAQLEEVRASRARIVEATLEERRRIERDLHDGVQQRLLALQLKIGAFNGSTNASSLLVELSDELHQTLLSLRDLAQGIHPTELRQFGIRGAIEVVAERLPLEVDLSIVDRRFGAVIESTIYFVICEALTNVVKHATATQAWVHVAVLDGQVNIEIRDDGNGQAQFRKGGGLEGLTDRLRTLGGELAITQQPVGSVVLSRFPLD
jgi:signal transduction histidine kinase